jgi:hypothetical protein
MTLWNYDKEVVASCRGEAAGPMAAGLIQSMRRAQRKLMHAVVIGRQPDLRRPG